jgi:hypothetical protein
LKLEELKYTKENLIIELTNLKEWAHGIERTSHHIKIKSLDSYKSDENQKEGNNYSHLEIDTNGYNDKDYKENMDSLKNVIEYIN